jgi:hypothetical protein
MSIFKGNVKVVSTVGHLPPQSVAAGATGAPTTGGYVAGTLLLGRALMAKCQTGAFVSTPSCAFKLSVADDANGTGVADVSGGTFATMATANQAVDVEIVITSSLIDTSKYYGVRCTVTGGTSALVGATLSLLDASYAA